MQLTGSALSILSGALLLRLTWLLWRDQDVPGLETA